MNVDASALVVKYTCELFKALSSAVESSGATLGVSSLRMEDRTEAGKYVGTVWVEVLLNGAEEEEVGVDGVKEYEEGEGEALDL